jgi:hypothetical protein
VLVPHPEEPLPPLKQLTLAHAGRLSFPLALAVSGFGSVHIFYRFPADLNGWCGRLLVGMPM